MATSTYTALSTTLTGTRGGVIGIRLETTGPSAARLTLWDDGKGPPEARPSGTDMQLIAGSARQIEAGAEWASDGGTKLSGASGK